MTSSNQDIISENNGCFDKITYCENYNPNSGSCKNSSFTSGKCSGQAVGDCCKKSCGKCKFYLMFHSKYILNEKKQMYYLVLPFILQIDLKLISSSATKNPNSYR